MYNQTVASTPAQDAAAGKHRPKGEVRHIQLSPQNNATKSFLIEAVSLSLLQVVSFFN